MPDIAALLAPTVMFSLSLLGALVLFKVLKSVAEVKKLGHRAGGALAGFLIIFTTLSLSHYKLLDVDELESDLESSNKKVESQLRTIEGLEQKLEASEEELEASEARCKSQQWEITGQLIPAGEPGEQVPVDNISVSVYPAFETKTDSKGNFSLWGVKLSHDQEANIDLVFDPYCCFQQVNYETASYDREKFTITLKEPISVESIVNDDVPEAETFEDEPRPTDHQGDA